LIIIVPQTGPSFTLDLSGDNCIKLEEKYMQIEILSIATETRNDGDTLKIRKKE